MNRRGFAGENQQAVAGHVAREIDEDVDLILPNDVCDLRIRDAHDTAPMRGLFLKTRGERVRPGNVCVAENLHLSAVMAGQKRLDEKRHRVLVKIRREISDSQAPIRCAVVGEGRNELREKLGMNRSPAAMLLK